MTFSSSLNESISKEPSSGFAARSKVKPSPSRSVHLKPESITLPVPVKQEQGMVIT